MFCPYCGTQVADDDMFCWNCGSKIASAKPSAAPQQSQPAPSSGQAQERPRMNSPAQSGSREASGGSGFRNAQAAGRTSAQRPAPRRQSDRGLASDRKEQVSGSASSGGRQVSAAADARPEPVRRPAAPSRTPDDPNYDLSTLPSRKESGKSSFYLLDFLGRMFTNKENIPLIIYLILNILLIGLIVTAFLTLPIGWGLLCGFLLYIASVSIALSPIGEAILRYQTGCHKITDPDVINRMEPIFREVYYKAKKADPSISADVRLFMNDEDCPNAFATGRKTVCITRGLMLLSDEQIKATLGHEFGHLSHKDTDRILVVAIGNLIIEGIYILFQLGAIIADIFMQIFAVFTGDASVFVSLMSSISRFFTLVVLAAFMRLWTALGTALCMKTSRGNEFQADEFSVHLGYADGLIALLQTIGGGPRPKGLFASLASSHPHSDDRIARIRQLVEEGSAQA